MAVLSLAIGVTQMIQAMAIAKVNSSQSLRAVLRFVLALTAALALVGFSPLGGVLVSGVMDVAGAAADLAFVAIRIVVGVPLLMAAGELLRGLLVLAERTRAVRLAAVVNLSVAALLLVGLLWLGVGSGVVVAALALVSGRVAEFAVLLAYGLVSIRALARQTGPAMADGVRRRAARCA